MSHTTQRPLLELWPKLRGKLPFAELAELPTPVTQLGELACAVGAQADGWWEKRDDLTSKAYGGNKVRTLEVLLARAAAEGSETVYATGAYGSNNRPIMMMVGTNPLAVLDGETTILNMQMDSAGYSITSSMFSCLKLRK